MWWMMDLALAGNILRGVFIQRRHRMGQIINIAVKMAHDLVRESREG